MDKTYSSILVRMPNWVGDVVMATPLLEDIRKKWPQAHLTVMCKKGLAPLFYGNPHITEVFGFTTPNEFQRRFDARDIIAKLSNGKYDLGILTTNSFSSAWWFWRGKIRRRIGFKNDFRSLLLTDALPVPEEKGKEHLVETYKRLLVPVGIQPSSSSPQLFVTNEERLAAEELLKQRGVPSKRVLIGFNPTAAFGPAKCWPMDRFKMVAQKLLEDPSNYLLFFGDKAGMPIVNAICENLPSRAINLAGVTSLRELIALISLCNAFLTNDSGPMHLAAALKTPLLALFGSTNEVATGPYKFGKIIHKHVNCSPCYKRVCPIDFRCMMQIEVDEVLKELKSLL